MRKLTLLLASAACIGLAAPAFASGKLPPAQNGHQAAAAHVSGKYVSDDFSAAKKKKKKVPKKTTSP